MAETSLIRLLSNSPNVLTIIGCIAWCIAWKRRRTFRTHQLRPDQMPIITTQTPATDPSTAYSFDSWDIGRLYRLSAGRDL